MDNAEEKYQKNHFLGSGWSFPVEFSVGNHQLVTTEYETNINESIRTILNTNNGERYMDQQFGSGLQAFFFSPMDEALKGEIAEAVSYALLINEPRITVEGISVDFDPETYGVVVVSIDYVFNQTNTRYNYVFPFHLNEGTNIS